MTPNPKNVTKIPAPEAKVPAANGFHAHPPLPPAGEAIQNHPLASAAGSFADDPVWDEFLKAMEDSRREIDERALKDLGVEQPRVYSGQ